MEGKRNEELAKVQQLMTGEEFCAMMERIEASNAGQEKYAKKQYHMSQITALASVIILGIVLYTVSVFIPKVNVTYQNMELIMEDLQTITSGLAEADISKMIDDVDELAVRSQENIGKAMEKIEAIDIEGLNQAIQNLSDAVGPFAEFFNKFR